MWVVLILHLQFLRGGFEMNLYRLDQAGSHSRISNTSSLSLIPFFFVLCTDCRNMPFWLCSPINGHSQEIYAVSEMGDLHLSPSSFGSLGSPCL